MPPAIQQAKSLLVHLGAAENAHNVAVYIRILAKMAQRNTALNHETGGVERVVLSLPDQELVQTHAMISINVKLKRV